MKSFRQYLSELKVWSSMTSGMLQGGPIGAVQKTARAIKHNYLNPADRGDILSNIIMGSRASAVHRMTFRAIHNDDTGMGTYGGANLTLARAKLDPLGIKQNPQAQEEYARAKRTIKRTEIAKRRLLNIRLNKPAFNAPSPFGVRSAGTKPGKSHILSIFQTY